MGGHFANMKTFLFVWIALAHFSCGFPVQGTAVQYNVGTTYSYNYHTEVRSNEPKHFGQTTTQSVRDVGVKLDAVVHVAAVWSAGPEMLIQIKVINPKILSAARPQLSRELKILSRLPVYVQLDDGKIGHVFVGEDDTNVSINVKRGIASLLQLHTSETQRVETDTSGECHVSYVIDDDLVTKTKTDCKNIEYGQQYSNINPVLDVNMTSFSQSVYAIDNDIIKSVEVNERYLAVVNLENSLAVQMTSLQEMRLVGTEAGAIQVTGTSVSEIMNKINKKADSQFYGSSLTAISEVDRCSNQQCEQFGKKVSELRAYLTSEKVATVEASTSFLSLVQIARHTTEESLMEVLKSKENEDIVAQLIDVLVASQTTASHSALMKFLDFSKTQDISLLERYLLATAFSTHPNEELLKTLLSLYKKQLRDVRLQESIGEALGAVVYTYCQIDNNCQKSLINEIRQEYLTQLKACTTPACESVIIRALSNAAFQENIPMLLEYAETSTDSIVSEAAIKALRRFNSTHINQSVRDVMKRIYHQRFRGYDTAVRTLALRLILTTNPSEDEIIEIMNSTNDPYQTELDAFVQAFLFNKMADDSALEKFVGQSLKNPEINNYNILAPKGKSLSFTANLTATDSVTATYDMYVENSRAGLLKRSGLDVKVVAPSQTLTLYSFGIFAGGLEGLIGEEVEAGQEDEIATAGLALDILDVSLRPVTFFEGQAALMSAVWSAPAELTSALQATLLMLDHLSHIHLQNGLTAKLELHGAVSTDLSGLVSISLWNKNCHALIKNSGSIAVQGSFAIETPTFHTGVEFATESASNIDFVSDVDFYDKLKSCLQMSRPDIAFKKNFTKFEYIRGLKKNYRANIRRTARIDSVSYPLPKSNYAMCRALLLE